MYIYKSYFISNIKVKKIFFVINLHEKKMSFTFIEESKPV